VSLAVTIAVALLAPLAMTVADPQGDLGPCEQGFPTDGRSAPIDIVEARGEIVERGMALRFTIVFAEPLPAPDEEGRPLRIDVVLRDPDVPTVSFRYYRDLNRIVRFDAVPDPLLQVVLLPERGANIFVGATAIGDTLTMTFPGRLITRDRDLEGLGLERLRWGVIARDDDACDVVGGGRPTLRLTEEASPSPTPQPAEAAPDPGEDPDRARRFPAWAGWALFVLPIAGLWVYALVLRRRVRSAR
jgi:hypothetical protein